MDASRDFSLITLETNACVQPLVWNGWRRCWRPGLGRPSLAGTVCTGPVQLREGSKGISAYTRNSSPNVVRISDHTRVGSFSKTVAGSAGTVIQNPIFISDSSCPGPQPE